VADRFIWCAIPVINIFNPPIDLHKIMKDYMLALFVCALVTVDVVILFVYTLVEGLMGNLEPTRTVHAENPSDSHGVSRVDTITIHA